MIISLLIMILMLLICLFFLFSVINSSKYAPLIEPIDSKDFSLKEVYGVGFRIIDILKVDFRGKTANKIRQDAVVLYGTKFSEYYLRVFYAQLFSITYLTIMGGFIFSSLSKGSDKFILLGLGLIVSGAVYNNYQNFFSKKIKKLSAQYMSDFPNAVSTIALLVNAGLMLREAWRQVAFSAENELFLQMRKVSEDMDNGVSEIDALYAFSNRCATNEIKKFTSFIVQGLEKGSKDLAISLKSQSEELWEIKKQNVLRQGELASNKLLIPILIMFIGVLVMVMGPLMTNLDVM